MDTRPRLRKSLLALIFCFTAVHFLKDITQDILKIATPLDFLGDVKEDLSSFPVYIQSTFYWLGISSFVAEAFLLFSIPKIFNNKTSSTIEKSVYWVVIALLIYFAVAILFDPRFRFFSQ